MRVLQLVIGLDIGGLEDVVVNLTRHLRLHKVSCHLGCLASRGTWCERAEVDDVWEGNMPARGKYAAITGLCRHVRRNGIDLIHSHNRQAFLYGVAASLVTGIPIVYTKHGREWSANRSWMRIERLLLGFTDSIVGVSADITGLILELQRVPKRKARTIRNGIDTARFSPPAADRDSIRRQLGIPPDSFVVGSVGRFSPEKNYGLLIRAFAALIGPPRDERGAGSNKGTTGQQDQLMRGSSNQEQRTSNEEPSDTPPHSHTPILPHNPPRHPTPILLLVGDGPERPKLDALVRSLGIAGSVNMPGMQADVVPWLGCMNVFCLSSLTEGTSISLLEAGSCEVPGLVTNVGGNIEIIEDWKTGIAAPAGDEKAFAHQLQKLWSDDLLRQQMGKAARQRIMEFYSAERMAREYLALYSEVLQRNAGTDRR